MNNEENDIERQELAQRVGKNGDRILMEYFDDIGLTIAVIWSIVTWLSRYVSLGSIVAIALSPIIMWFFNARPAYIIYALIAAVYVIYLHRENIKRLRQGTENKVR